jgi:hypothetical protein
MEKVNLVLIHRWIIDLMLNRRRVQGRGFLYGGFALDLLAVTSPRPAEALYMLNTICTIKAGAPLLCSVEDIKGGLGTLTSVARNKDAMNKAVDITTA